MYVYQHSTLKLNYLLQTVSWYFSFAFFLSCLLSLWFLFHNFGCIAKRSQRTEFVAFFRPHSAEKYEMPLDLFLHTNKSNSPTLTQISCTIPTEISMQQIHEIQMYLSVLVSICQMLAGGATRM